VRARMEVRSRGASHGNILAVAVAFRDALQLPPSGASAARCIESQLSTATDSHSSMSSREPMLKLANGRRRSSQSTLIVSDIQQFLMRRSSI
jgi:hypothetical protein